MAGRAVRRRRFLGGALCGAGAVALGLPLLESIGPVGASGRWARRARADAPVTPRRFVALVQCNGIDVARFWPEGPFGPLTVEAFSGATALAPLVDHRDRLLLPRGLHMVPSTPGLPGNSHMRGIGYALTAAPLAEGSKYASGPSIDQVIAAAGQGGGAPPLNLFVGTTEGGVLDHVSYLAPEQPAPIENNPWLVYQDLVGLEALDAEARARVIARRESVLDLVAEEYEALLAGPLSAADRDKLDYHFTLVRELETGLDAVGLVPFALPEDQVAAMASLDPETVGHDARFELVSALMLDLVAVALASGHARVATIQCGAASGGPVYTWGGMTHEYDHHTLSHGNTKEDESGEPIAGYLDRVHEIDRWYAGRFARLLDRLTSYVEPGAGTLLDSALALWINELSDGYTHDSRDLPWVMAGSCGGYFRTGEQLRVTAAAELANQLDAPHNKLLAAILNATGVTAAGGGPVTMFGDPAHCEPGELDVVKV
ncbi:MAG: DUF1552 domain-containing protein [Myxococcales bacterium]|nr:DUF1552 domain-containing protein [Myxococcales bacterium]